MSASLVGSGVYKRQLLGLMRELAQPNSARGSGGSVLRALANCERHGPVSYTHLTLPTICSV
eukprot:11520175-Alexandrium_andersonii.AAC.1